MNSYNSIFEINFHKINQNCGNLPESFLVDKFHAYFSTDLSGISTSFHELKFSREYFGSLFYWQYFHTIFALWKVIFKKRSSKFSTTFPE